MKKLVLSILLLGMLTPVMAKGYIKPIDDFNKYQIVHERTTLPSSFDSRNEGWTLDPRDQMIDGTCWAFSCVSAWQILCHKNNLTTGYLSPQLLSNCHEGFLLEHMTGGGNSRVANSMLARLEGVVTEEAVPYNHKDLNCPNYDKKDTPTYILGWNYLPENDAIAIKENIMEYGAVSANIYFNYSSLNTTTGIYQYNGEEGPNHAVTLIGWDDNKQAWLAQNSWGENSFYGDYLWISYDDALVSVDCTSYTNLTPVSSIDKVYHHTTTGTLAGYGIDTHIVSDGIVEFNFGEGEQLVAIGTGVPAANTRLTFSVIDLDKHAFLYVSDPVTVTYSSFYKHELPTPLTVSGNIHIAVTYYSETGKHVIPIEGNIPNYSEVELKKGCQWIDFYESGEWIPMGTDLDPYNLGIYAYTKEKTTNLNETSDTNKRAFNGTQIADDIWESARCIHVYGIDGKLYKTLSESDSTLPSLVTGVYLLVVEKQDGSAYTEKIWIQ